MSDFEKAFALVMRFEGGYSNDSRDPGGETKFGISKRAYPHLDIVNLTEDQAKDIYHTDYWQGIYGDLLPYPINVLIFDAAVNHGKKRAVRMLQEALKIKSDGLIGEQTIKAVKSASDEFCAVYLAKRARQYAKTRNFAIYGDGWLKRLFVLALHIGSKS